MPSASGIPKRPTSKKSGPSRIRLVAGGGSVGGSLTDVPRVSMRARTRVSKLVARALETRVRDLFLAPREGRGLHELLGDRVVIPARSVALIVRFQVEGRHARHQELSHV